MNGRKWKPGDVAIVAGERAMRMPFDAATCPANHDRVDHWHGSDGYWITDSSVAHENARPLVVIDPDDREDVERIYLQGFLKIMADREISLGFLEGTHCVDAFQDALRDRADPPRPCSATLVIGRAGAVHPCTKPDGHLEPHRAEHYSWTAGVQQVTQ